MSTASSRLSVRRLSEPRGVFGPSFQADVTGTTGEADNKIQALPLYLPFGFLSVPLVGCYGDDYMPLLPLVLLAVPAPPKLEDQKVNDDLKTAAAADVSGYVIVHDGMSERAPCGHLMCDRTDELSLMYHTWRFAKTTTEKAPPPLSPLRVGMFRARGVEAVHQDLVDGGAPFNTVEERGCVLHGDRFSPCNNQIRLVADADVHSFLALAIDKDRQRQVWSFHIIAGTQEVAACFRDIVCDSRVETVEELLVALAKAAPEAVSDARALFGI